MIKAKSSRLAVFIGIALGLSACSEDTKTEVSSNQATSTAKAATKPTAAQAKQFLQESQDELFKLSLPSAQAAWAYQTYINQDTAGVSAYLGERISSRTSEIAKESAKFNDVEVDADTRRMLDLLRYSLVLPPPANAEKSERLAAIGTEMEGMYGAGKYCREDGECWSLTEMSAKMATERDPELLLEIWQGWREISPPMKALYEEQATIANEGAKELGFTDVSELWRGKYDMPANDFEVELDRLWGQVKPFYDALHCHVRAELGNTYGTDVVPQDKPIPAHLLGNMWAQTWSNVYDIAKPKQEMQVPDVTKALEDKGYDEIEMVKKAEGFFTSLGFEPLPQSFWERSLFQKPSDRDVVCHASAWNLDYQDDLRIKMCIQKTGEELAVIHHELGHNFYQRAYNQLPLLYQTSANDGFHEAIGDTIALSVTPKYLQSIGLIEDIPDASNDIGMLLKTAMDKIAFVPFGLLVDKWRWGVFSGKVKPEDYNQYWWELREQYQGVAAPVARSADAFDPGAKYHIPGNTPYSRYFLAHILQFQFHRSLCEIAGDTGPVHRCSIAGNKAAGKALNDMLMMGQSKPWQDALEVLTGTPEMDATAILDYFAPLKTWLDEQNQGRQCGW